MDFIKTSSLRALSELTFQRNWNGLIWMSRKGVITKRVKTVQTALSRKRPNRAVRLAEKRCFRSAKIIRPSEVSAKVQTIRPNASRPGKQDPRSAKPRPLTPCRARPCRASRQSLAAAHLRVPRPMAPSEPGSNVPRPENSSANLTSVRPRAERSVRPRPFRPRPRPDVRPIVPTDRPNAAVDPKPVLKPVSYFQGPA
ncbi:unnamed protein product [Microthlaspi erraticum]|uniref:Uncharacterized protein n=1 Tax=Microthlaspi erraticum TaxID=1685480 RepID=A0A6D2KZS2_9BRAS|nr:unnamed protein product [Microthlaspi erraticum]